MRASRPVMRQATDLFRACLLNGALDGPRVGKVFDEMAAARPRGYLATLTTFLRLVKLEYARHTAMVLSAHPLSPDMQDALRHNLARAYGPGLNISFAVKSALLGGVRIQVGSDVYDGTVDGRLAALEQNL